MLEFEFQADDTREYAIVITLTVLNVVGVGLAAGMTLGYTSLDTMRLKIKAEMGTKDEKDSVGKVLSLLKNRHQFLCTLLVFNVICAECLPLLMDTIMPKWLSLLLSVTFVLLAGEVIPAGIFTGPQRLDIARRLVGFSKFLQFIFSPIAYPLAKMLDYLVGTEENEILTRDELMCMMKITREVGLELQDTAAAGNDNYPDKSSSSSSHRIQMEEKDVLLPEEVNAIRGVLSLTHKKVKELMIPIEDTYMISSSSILDKETLVALDNSGHSRVPVYHKQNRQIINGFILVKKLISVDPNEEQPLENHLAVKEPLYIDSSHRAIDMLERFQTGKAHIAIVSKNSQKLLTQMRNNESPSSDCAPVGILTMENILEDILQEPIYDEEDLRKQSISSSCTDDRHGHHTYVPSRLTAYQKKYSHHNVVMGRRQQQRGLGVGYGAMKDNSSSTLGGKGGEYDDDIEDQYGSGNSEKDPLL